LVAALTRIDESTYSIDLQFQGQDGVIAAYLVESAGERAIIEIGPTSTLGVLLAALREAEIEPESIGKILVTHIHLDHAGASGAFIRRFPQAQLYVHERGAPHMSDPSRLLRSATRIYGDMMDQLWGAVEPVPESKMTILTDGDTVTVGDRSFDVLYTPGHASHHVAYHDRARDAVVAGDVAAVRMQGTSYVRPPTPPPDIDLELWEESLNRLRALRPRVLYLTHFGPFTDVEAHLDQAQEQLREWEDIIRRAMESGQDTPEIVDNVQLHADRELLEHTGDASMFHRYELAAPCGMSVDGYLRYFQTRAPSAR
jgi:glyoxylase-like metal-dependent hydrolase (beta-lactamase superfamily II)